ncbi:hypothetical protein [Yokenella regensburgei]|uniref:hypothetical protein n=1 Tax=Yokenella regensburgei TaxID=158877 RepID=UPI00315892EC
MKMKESEILQATRAFSPTALCRFIVDYLRLIISGNMNTFEIEALMDEEIETHESEAEVPANSLRWWGLSRRLVSLRRSGWFMAGVCRPSGRRAGFADCPCDGGDVSVFCWRMVLSRASVLRQKSAETTKMMQCVKITLLSNLNGYAPPIAVEFGRKTLYSSERPSFIELEEHVRAVRNPTAQQQTTTEDA